MNSEILLSFLKSFFHGVLFAVLCSCLWMMNSCCLLSIRARSPCRTLKEMVKRHGQKKWAVVAQALPGRIGKQCRERYTNHLHPNIKVSSLDLRYFSDRFLNRSDPSICVL